MEIPGDGDDGDFAIRKRGINTNYKFQRVHGALLNLSTRTETILYATEHVASEEAKWGME